MIELAERYNYNGNRITVPNTEGLQSLYEGREEGIRVPLTTSEGKSIQLFSSGKEMPTGRRWYLITAIDSDNQPIGFIDIWFNPDAPIGPICVLDTTYIRKTFDYDIKFYELELRIMADVDGIFVIEKERKRGIGRTLLFTAMEIAKMAGAGRFHVKPSELGRSFFEFFGPVDFYGTWAFDLDSEYSANT